MSHDGRAELQTTAKSWNSGATQKRPQPILGSPLVLGIRAGVSRQGDVHLEGILNAGLERSQVSLEPTFGTRLRQRVDDSVGMDEGLHVFGHGCPFARNATFLGVRADDDQICAVSPIPENRLESSPSTTSGLERIEHGPVFEARIREDPIHDRNDHVLEGPILEDAKDSHEVVRHRHWNSPRTNRSESDVAILLPLGSSRSWAANMRSAPP